MPDIWMDVDAALAEVPVNILPLIDDTDFKSIEDNSVAYNATGLELIWHFATAAGAFSSTVVTPTTGGNYDWAHQDGGIYTIEIPASGGASINNDTEGTGWFTGKATGVLPWRGPTIGFRRAALNDLLIEGGTASTNLEDFFDGTGYAGGTAKLGVDVVAISGDTTAADNCELMFDGTGYAGGTERLDVNVVEISDNSGAAGNLEAACDGTGFNIGGGAVVAASVTGAVGSVTAGVTVTTNNDKTGYSLAADQSAVTIGTVTTLTGHTPQTGDAYARIGAPAGASVSADVAAVKGDTAAILTDTGTTLDGKIDTISGYLDTEVAAILADTNELQTDLANGGRLDLLVDAIKAKTDNLPASPAATGAQMDLVNAPNATAITAIQNGLATPTNITAGTITTVTNLTNAPTNGDLTATMKASVTAAVPTANAIADQVWDEAIAGHAGAGSTGAALSAAGGSGDPWSTALPGAYGAGTAGYIVGTDIPAILADTGTTLQAELDGIQADTEDLQAQIGTAGAGLTAVPWNAAWDAEVQSEAADALTAYDPPTNAELEARTLVAANYFDPAADVVAHVTLVDTTTTNTDMVAAAPSAAIVADAVWDETLADHAGVGSTGAALSAAGGSGDPWSTALPGAYGAGTAGYIVGTDIPAILADTGTTLQAELDGIQADTEDLQAQIGTAGAGLTAVPWNAAWDAEVQSEAADALTAYDPPTNAELEARTLVAANYATASALATVDDYVDSEVAAIKAVTDKLDTALELDGAVYRYTANALEEAPTGGSAPTVGEIADAVWDELLSGHTDVGTVGEALATAAEGGGSLTAQEVRDAMKLAPTAGDPATGSVDLHLDDLLTNVATVDTVVDAIKAKTDLLDTSAVTVASGIDGGDLTFYVGATFDVTITGLTIPSDWTKALFTLKEKDANADSAALLQVQASNPGVAADGLIRINGAAPGTGEDAWAALTVTQAAGTAALKVHQSATAALLPRRGRWDIKVLTSDSPVEGTLLVAPSDARIRYPVTRSTT